MFEPHVDHFLCVASHRMSVKRKPTKRVLDLVSPAKRMNVEDDQSQETQETSQRKFDTAAFYEVGEQVPPHLWVREEKLVPFDDPRAVAQRKKAADELAKARKPTGGSTLAKAKKHTGGSTKTRDKATTGGSRKPTGASKKRQSKKERQPQSTGGPLNDLRPGDLIKATYRTTNRETSTGLAERTLLVIGKGTTMDTPYYREGLPVAPGLWCMHGGTRKFFVMERFVTMKEISVLDALQRKDSPLVLRATYDKDVQATLQALRKVNTSLTYSSSNLGLHSQYTLSNKY